MRDSLSQRGESWRMSFHAVYDDGTTGPRCFETLKGCKSASRKAAVAEASRRLAEMTMRTNKEPPCEATLASVFTEMADALLRTKAIEESTYAGYLGDAKLFGFLGDMRPCDIESSDVVEYVSSMVEDRSVSAARRGLKTVRRALNFAMEQGLVDRNVAKGVKGPKACDTSPKMLQDEERRSLVKICDELDGVLPLAVRIALSTGLRRGEVCGLQWRDIDFNRRTLKVVRSIGEDWNGGTYVKEPKSQASRRVLPLEEGLLGILKKEKSRRQAVCVSKGAELQDDFYVIGSVDGRFMPPKELGQRFAHLAESFNIAGGKCRFHWLRHTFASALIAQGVDIRTVSAWLGHSDPGFTLQAYVDLDQEAMRRSVFQVERMFAPDGPVSGKGPDLRQAATIQDAATTSAAARGAHCSTCPYRHEIASFLTDLAKNVACSDQTHYEAGMDVHH